MQVSLGIDLFSEVWMAEGSIISLGKNAEGDAAASLQEFNFTRIYINICPRSSNALKMPG